MTDTGSNERSNFVPESVSDSTQIETIICETETINQTAVLITECGGGEAILSDSLTMIPNFSNIPRLVTGAYKEFQSISTKLPERLQVVGRLSL
jgi:hypothetical protein